MIKILIIYSTTDGHTRKICSRLKQLIENPDSQVTVVDIENGNTIDLNEFDKVVIGASIRYGKHSQLVYEFINNNYSNFDRKPNAFFSVNVVARKREKSHPQTNPYMKKFLKQVKWKPKQLAVFAGKIDYQKYTFWDRLAIRLIMWITSGPTDPKTNIEFTDWSQVEDFGRVICEM